MATKLFETNDRTTAHRHLAEVLAAGEFPRAECRENHNEESPYQVWSDAEVREPAPPSPPIPQLPPQFNVKFTDEELEKIASMVAKQLKGDQS
jgi:hypothetical protein